jgi:hypothetical protein
MRLTITEFDRRGSKVYYEVVGDPKVAHRLSVVHYPYNPPGREFVCLTCCTSKCTHARAVRAEQEKV